MAQFDYIILGAGAAGLMLADAMGKDPFFASSRILLLDQDPKNTNDRTWCFWEQGKGSFDELLSASWEYITVAGRQFSIRSKIAPYRYKMLRGQDFYQACLGRIRGYGNVTFEVDTVLGIQEREHVAEVSGKKASYTTPRVFNSILNPAVITGQTGYPVLQQHFAGWVIETAQPVFNADTATFMDFSVPQRGNTRFIYVLPFSGNRALVEYTLFSSTPLPVEWYEEGITSYMKDHYGVTRYEVLEKESGNIPMTCFDFRRNNSRHVSHIGTAGGWSKPSTGYTFMNTSKKTGMLVAHLKSGRPLHSFYRKSRFWYYDLLLLDILYRHNDRGSHIFLTLFRKRSPPLILRFLDEETNFWEDLRVIAACPKMWFIEAFFIRIGTYFRM